MQKSLSVFAAIVVTDLALGKISIDNSTRQFVDEFGRSVMFHGVNVVYKVAPYIPILNTFDAQNSLSPKDLQDLQDWGQNFVRLGVMWEAVEREPGVYDYDYLAAIDALITQMGEYGIYTLVDMH
jgi:endoglycosylceramidase